MKKILCFGDSNTYGFNPQNGQRLANRWTNVLQKIDKNYIITEAGANNRTAFCKDKNGISGVEIIKDYLTEKFDIIILAIGINDLQTSYNCDLKTFKNGIKELVITCKTIQPHAKIVILSPSIIKENILSSYFGTLFDRNSIEKSHKITPIYKNIAEENNCIFLNLNNTAKVSDIDSLHYEESEHKKIAIEIQKLINKTI